MILWNGQNKFNDATFGSPHLMMEYPLDNVEQIEINSSSPSPLLGGSAMMTINIITTDQKSTTNEAYVTTGFSESNGLLSKRISTNFHNSLNEWRIAGALQYFDDLGFTYNQDVKNSSVYKLRNGNKGSVSMQWNIQSPNKKIELGSSYRNINKDAFLSNLVYSESSDLYKYEGKTFMNYLKLKPIDGFEISAGYTQLMFDNVVNLEQSLPIGINQTENVPYGIKINNGNFLIF